MHRVCPRDLQKHSLSSSIDQNAYLCRPHSDARVPSFQRLGNSGLLHVLSSTQKCYPRGDFKTNYHHLSQRSTFPLEIYTKGFRSCGRHHRMATPFNNVPDEILLVILSSVNITDHLSVKLVSKRFLSWASAIDTTTLTLAQAAKCHAAIEATFPRSRALVCCCCTRCGRVKDTTQFGDHQATKTKANRMCIACGIRNRKYSKRCMPSVGGEMRIPCYDCVTPRSLYDGWKLKSAEATILLGLRRDRDIFCERCLEARLRFVAFPHCAA